MNDEQYTEKLKAIEKAKQSIDDAVRETGNFYTAEELKEII